MPYFFVANAQILTLLKSFTHCLKSSPTKITKMQEYPQDFINLQGTSSNLLAFYSVNQVHKDPPFLNPHKRSINVCQCWRNFNKYNNWFISQISLTFLIKVRIRSLLKAANWDLSVNRLLYCYCPLLNLVIAAPT